MTDGMIVVKWWYLLRVEKLCQFMIDLFKDIDPNDFIKSIIKYFWFPKQICNGEGSKFITKIRISEWFNKMKYQMIMN